MKTKTQRRNIFITEEFRQKFEYITSTGKEKFLLEARILVKFSFDEHNSITMRYFWIRVSILLFIEFQMEQNQEMKLILHRLVNKF